MLPRLLTIAIPTYNRAPFLKNLLSQIAPQIKELGRAEICISDNCSTDETGSVVLEFQKNYPGLIRYVKQPQNFGVNVNYIKVMKLAEGDFVWLLGDDDVIVSNGLKKVIEVIENGCDQNTGLLALGHKSYFIDKVTGKEVVYYRTVNESKPKVYDIAREDIIRLNFPNSAFISVLIYNNHFLKKIFEEENEILQKAVKERDYVYHFIYQLMFLKYPALKAVRYNEVIIDEELHYYKFYIEDKFRLHYAIKKALDGLLSSTHYGGEYQKIVAGWDRDLAKGVIIEMLELKCFDSFNYDSFLGCINLFFKKAPVRDAWLFSISFTLFTIVPAFVLRNLFKLFIRVRHKERWQEVWNGIVITNAKMATGTRRMLS